MLDRALELPDAERGAWLAALSARDPGMAARIMRAIALRDTQEFSGFLAGDGPMAAGESARDPPLGSSIGPYTLDKVIGRGGMGTVWLAHRTDGLLNRSVALKLPNTGLASHHLLARFGREREILAKLNHPNIAHLYDAGVDRQGQPYLAMQFVVGEPLLDYCDAHKLGITDKLELFLQVLAAVHHAHAQKVIHRDLKPSNILVQADGKVALLDFGIAKLLVVGETGDTNLTRQGMPILTPNYASPEQLSGEPLGPASDVYSLGVVLYELLCGRRPYPVDNPRRPSEIASDAEVTSGPYYTLDTHRRKIRGDLDIIVLKALKPDPRDRYPGAGAFAEDLQRFLRGDPVAARPPSRWYRGRKFALRHRAGLFGAVMAAAVVGLSIWGSGLFGGTRRDVFAPPVHSIAVLPFVNLSGDATQDYLGEGISEELLNELSNLSELQVAARTSSFSFKGRNADVATIARALNVGAIVEGSVRRDGDSVRITAELINAVTGYHIWSQTYNGSFADMLKVQTEVASAVTKGLKIKLMGEEAASFGRSDTTNAAAYDAYLRGIQLYYRPNTGEAGYRAAAEAFGAATHLDPHFAMAYTRQSSALIKVCMIGTNPNERAALRSQARAAAERAVELTPRLGEAHLALALAQDIGVEDRAEAAREYEQALTLAPGSAWVEMFYALFTSESGHYDAAVTAARKAVSLDPQNIDTWKALGVVLGGARRFAEATAVFEEARALQPESHFIAFYLADNLLAMHQFDAARKQCELPETPLDADGRHDCLALAYHALGRQADAEKQMAEFKAQDGDSAAYRYARIYAQWGDKAKAWQWLNKAEQLGDPDLSLLKADWHFDPIRNEPQFKSIEARMNYLP